MAFFQTPDKASITHTFAATLLFCLPFAGTKELGIFMVATQILFILLVFVAFRKDYPSLLGTIRHRYPVTLYLFLAWLAASFVSLSIIFTTPTNGWQRLFAFLRQVFILVEIGFCISLIRFLLASGKPYRQLLLSFATGVIGMAFLHFAILFWGPACESESWLKDPFLSPNMRDIGDLTSVAIAIFGTAYWLGKGKHESAVFWLCLTISWAYLLWTGGRTAIASSLLVSVLALAICRKYTNLPAKKVLMTCAAMAAAFLLCTKFSIYDWNGIVRFSTDWRPSFNPNGDVTSGRMDMWKWAIEAFLQQPWFGRGTYSFYFIPARFDHQFWHDHPHNLIIQCLIEWGIIGTVLVLALLSSLAIIGIRQLGEQTKAGNSAFLMAGSAILTLSMGSMLGGSYWDYQPVIILAVLFAAFPLLPALSSSKPEESKGHC